LTMATSISSSSSTRMFNATGASGATRNANGISAKMSSSAESKTLAHSVYEKSKTLTETTC
jgi:hypothetical protein